MLKIINKTPWRAGAYLDWDWRCQRQWTVVLKASFEFGDQEHLQPASDVPAIVERDSYEDESELGSLQQVNEIMPFKCGSELYVHGTAYAPMPDCRHFTVEMGLSRPEHKPWSKCLRIFGHRRWQRRRRFSPWLSPSQPDIVRGLPLSYAYAYGGVDPGQKNKVYSKNPNGLGFAGRARHLLDSALPQIEWDKTPLRSPRSRPLPAGFAPLSENMQGRHAPQAQSADTAVYDKPCPYPQVLLPTYFHAAPPDQWFSQPFYGGEQLILRGLLPDYLAGQRVVLVVPRLVFDVRLFVGNLVHLLRLNCDTVVVDTNRCLLSMIWRAGITLPQALQQDATLVIREPRLKKQSDYVQQSYDT